MVQVIRNIIFQRKFNAKTSSNGGLRLESLVVDLGINMLWPQAGRDCRPYSCRKTVTMCAARAKCGSNVAQKMARWALVKAWIAPKMGCNVLKYLKWPKHQYTGAFKPLFCFLPKHPRSSKTAISFVPTHQRCQLKTLIACQPSALPVPGCWMQFLVQNQWVGPCSACYRFLGPWRLWSAGHRAMSMMMPVEPWKWLWK